MNPNYRLNAGQYVLHDGDRPVGALQEEVAIALDHDSGTLHKHGVLDRVQAWHAQAQSKLRGAGMHEMADNLVIVCGKFPLEELNRCLSCSGYAGIFYHRLLAGQLAQEPRTLPSTQAPP